MKIDDTNPRNDKQESYNDTEVQERLNDIDRSSRKENGNRGFNFEEG